MTADEAWEEWFNQSAPSEVIGIKAMMRSAFVAGFYRGWHEAESTERQPVKD